MAIRVVQTPIWEIVTKGVAVLRIAETDVNVVKISALSSIETSTSELRQMGNDLLTLAAKLSSV